MGAQEGNGITGFGMSVSKPSRKECTQHLPIVYKEPCKTDMCPNALTRCSDCLFTTAKNAPYWWRLSEAIAQDKEVEKDAPQPLWKIKADKEEAREKQP